MTTAKETMPRLLKWSVIVYVAVMLACIAGYVRYDQYGMDGDAVSFLDMSQALQHGHPELAINGYWNPAYSVTVAIGDWVLRPARYHELHANYRVNAAIFVLALLAVAFYARSLTQLRAGREAHGHSFALSARVLQLLGFALVFRFWTIELSVARVRSDGLMLVFLVTAAGFGMRLLATRRMVYALPLGLAFAAAYYTKSFGFVASFILFALIAVAFLLPREMSGEEQLTLARRAKSLLPIAVAALVFLVAVAPYVAGVSRQRGRFTFGDSSRLMYAWDIDGADSIHEAYTHNLGHATNNLKHPERRLLEQPEVYAYDQHLMGTNPIWFDPDWWHDDTVPHTYLREQVHTILRDIKTTGRFALLHFEPLALLVVMLALGFRIPANRRWLPLLVPMAWALAMWLVYVLLLVEDRYLDPPYLIFLLPLFALMQIRANKNIEDDDAVPHAQSIAFALVLMMAAMVASGALRSLAEMRATVSLAQVPGGWYDANVQSAARGLAAIGVQPGDRVACVGDYVCHGDPYWAYLAGTQMVGEVTELNFPQDTAHDAAVLTALHGVGAKVIVASTRESVLPATGWQQLGNGMYYARRIP